MAKRGRPPGTTTTKTGDNGTSVIDNDGIEVGDKSIYQDKVKALLEQHGNMSAKKLYKLLQDEYGIRPANESTFSQQVPRWKKEWGLAPLRGGGSRKSSSPPPVTPKLDQLSQYKLGRDLLALLGGEGAKAAEILEILIEDCKGDLKNALVSIELWMELQDEFGDDVASKIIDKMIAHRD